jgi:hypothetical protein
MSILRLSLTYICLHWQRFLIYICLTVSLCTFAGLLGNYFLYGKKAVDPMTILLVDEDNSMESRLFYTILSEMEEYKTLLVFEKADSITASAALAENKATAAVTIPAGFAESVKNGSNEPFSVAYSAASPIKAALVKQFTDAFTKMLTATQIGVYAALDYTRETGSTADYATMFRGINLRYMNIVLNRADQFEIETVSTTGETGLFEYYVFAAYVFILFAGSLLFVDLLQKTLYRATLLKLNRLGRNSFRIATESMVAVFIMLLLINTVFLSSYFVAERFDFLPMDFEINTLLIVTVALLSLAVAAFTVFVAACFRSVFSAGIFVSLLSLVFLIISGGIVPVAYFPENIAPFSRFTLNYWAVRLLNDGFSGRLVLENVAPIVCVIVALTILAALLIQKNAKVGDRL